jgi:hypothetical protein
MLAKHSNIIDINVIKNWNHETDFREVYAMDISLNDGRSIFLVEFFSDLRAPFGISEIGGYGFDIQIFHRGYRGVGIAHVISSALIAQETGIKIDSVHDAIENYDVIYAYVLSLPDANIQSGGRIVEMQRKYKRGFRTITIDDTYFIFKAAKSKNKLVS